MKKFTILIFYSIFLMVPSFGFNFQQQEHQHQHQGRDLYEEQRIRYIARLYWQMPNRVLDELNITPGMTIADVGAGIGYFTIKLAERVGDKGKVYASDIDEDALAILNESGKGLGLDNIVIIHGQEDDPLIPKASVDLVLIVNTIQFVKGTTAFLNNIRSSLKENGKLVFIQWDAAKMDSELPGWSKEDREKYTIHTMLNMIYAANYEVLDIKYFLPMQLIYICQPSELSEENKEGSMEETSNLIPGSCTIFSASFGSTVLYGNNEDYRIPATYYWAEPSGEDTYGAVFVGFDNFSPQGGVNEKGLAFDYNALPESPLKPHPDLPDKGDIMKKIYQNCATVEEAIALAKKYNWGSSIRWQVLLADATGDAVVISAGPDEELAFTRKPKGNGYLVSTNFNRANLKNTYPGSYPCWRYNKAVEMLDKIKSEKDLTVDYFKSILDACHVEGARGNTLYSNVFDLKNGVIYLYHWHQFYETAELKVADILAKNPPPTRIKDLFSAETVKRAEDEFQKYKGKK